ncbi:MAG: shikimate kinase [Actinomycetota bacterium]
MEAIVLMGPPGAGKSTVGKYLARETGYKLLDTDRLIEEAEGRSVSEIFLADGENGFRKIEKEIVLKVLTEEDCIIALGGGSVLDADIQSALKRMNEVIFLDVSISNAAPRVGFNKERPLLMGNPRQQWLQLMEKRRGIYEDLAKRTISTDNRKAQDVAHEIVSYVKS